MINTEKYKKVLEEELAKLEKSLSRIGFKSSDNPDDWEAKPGVMDKTGADENESSDSIEEFEENSAKLLELEIRYNHVKLALKKIKEGKFGIDEVDGEPIPEARLDANPAARTKVENAEKLED